MLALHLKHLLTQLNGHLQHDTFRGTSEQPLFTEIWNLKHQSQAIKKQERLQRILEDLQFSCQLHTLRILSTNGIAYDRKIPLLPSHAVYTSFYHNESSKNNKSKNYSVTGNEPSHSLTSVSTGWFIARGSKIFCTKLLPLKYPTHINCTAHYSRIHESLWTTY